MNKLFGDVYKLRIDHRFDHKSSKASFGIVCKDYRWNARSGVTAVSSAIVSDCGRGYGYLSVVQLTKIIRLFSMHLGILQPLLKKFIAIYLPFISISFYFVQAMGNTAARCLGNTAA